MNISCDKYEKNTLKKKKIRKKRGKNVKKKEKENHLWLS
jgi:hypothetical protein